MVLTSPKIWWCFSVTCALYNICSNCIWLPYGCLYFFFTTKCKNQHSDVISAKKLLVVDQNQLCRVYTMKLPGYKRPKSSVCVLMVILSQKGRNLFQSILNKKNLVLSITNITWVALKQSIGSLTSLTTFSYVFMTNSPWIESSLWYMLEIEHRLCFQTIHEQATERCHLLSSFILFWSVKDASIRSVWATNVSSKFHMWSWNLPKQCCKIFIHSF